MVKTNDVTVWIRIFGINFHSFSLNVYTGLFFNQMEDVDAPLFDYSNCERSEYLFVFLQN